jgi:hypothetical protein
MGFSCRDSASDCVGSEDPFPESSYRICEPKRANSVRSRKRMDQPCLPMHENNCSAIKQAHQPKLLKFKQQISRESPGCNFLLQDAMRWGGTSSKMSHLRVCSSRTLRRDEPLQGATLTVSHPRGWIMAQALLFCRGAHGIHSTCEAAKGGGESEAKRKPSFLFISDLCHIGIRCRLGGL